MTKAEIIDKFGEDLEHRCPDWDYGIINKNMPEFQVCLCFKNIEK